MIKLWYYVEGSGDVFRVSISPAEDIYELKKQIYRESSLTGFSSGHLTLKKIDVDPDVIVKGQYSPDPNDQSLKSMAKIGNIWTQPPPDDRVHVFVILPTVVNTVEEILYSPLVLKYEELFISVKKWGAFEHSDIKRNKIEKCQTVPDFVARFEQELDEKPGVAPDVVDLFKRIDVRFRDAYFGVSQEREEVSATHQERRRNVEEPEMIHLMYIAGGQWERFWRGQLGNTLKEPSMDGMVFQYFALQADETVTVQTSNQSWPFSLITKCETIPINEQLRKYQPCSDLLILKSSFPRLLIEVNLKPRKEKPEDLIRMLLTGATVVRFANMFLDTFKEKKDFVLFAIYVWDNGRVTRYTLYQEPKKPEVRYKEMSYWLDTPNGRATFAGQLYNLCHILKRDGEAEDTYYKITELKETIEQHDEKFPMKSFFTKDNNNNPNGAKKRRFDDVGGGSDAGGAGGVHEADSDCAKELRAHGYEVKPQAEDIVDPSGKFILMPFQKMQMSSHILTVYQPSAPSKEFIAKKVREESNELEILKFLNGFQPRPEHIIALHDSFQAQSTSWAILPRMDSVADYARFSPNKLFQNLDQVCRGLIRGVAFLHKLSIAHRDIKPHNLLVDRNFCLKIIDFDIAVRVEDENEEVDDQCGTEHWLAPEIEKKLMYSPIKADRWSTGRVLLCLLHGSGKDGGPLMTIARKLTAHNPKQRPSMLEVAVSLSNVASKKASRPRQDRLEVDEERAKAPRVNETETFSQQSDGGVRRTSLTTDTSSYGSRSVI